MAFNTLKKYLEMMGGIYLEQKAVIVSSNIQVNRI